MLIGFRKRSMKKNKKWLSDPDYSFIYSRVPRACVDLVIKSSEGTLLAFRDIEPWKNMWHLPGGRVFFEETLFQAARRIAKEEVGLRVEPIKIVGAMEFPNEAQKGEKRHTISTAILAHPVSGVLKGGPQARRLKYFKSIPANTAPAHKKFLKNFGI
jgi:ADP-ribose pyrophosphatase YjhB (NUDIX family)